MRSVSLGIEERLDRNLIETKYLLRHDGKEVEIYHGARSKDIADNSPLDNNAIDMILQNLLLHTKEDDTINTGMPEIPCTTRQELVWMVLSRFKLGDYPGEYISDETINYTTIN